MICVGASGRGVSDDVSFVGEVTVMDGCDVGGVDSDELMLRRTNDNTNIIYCIADISMCYHSNGRC